MDARTKALFDARAKVIKAIAHPSRLFIVDRLAGSERCVCELTEMIGADISTVSKHLALLKRAGIVEARKEGLQVFYSLKTPCIMRFFDCIESVRSESLAGKAKSSCCGR